ncbi:hypothetical protein V6N12_031097 [Hibiscus sabdariffa]|uniref:Uncharacterized protein n=1 Tax=Hibiscus sabdariffa TaxID=183260 RepID=A0ABR2E7X2_9ROSI
MGRFHSCSCLLSTATIESWLREEDEGRLLNSWANFDTIHGVVTSHISSRNEVYLQGAKKGGSESIVGKSNIRVINDFASIPIIPPHMGQVYNLASESSTPLFDTEHLRHFVDIAISNLKGLGFLKTLVNLKLSVSGRHQLALFMTG